MKRWSISALLALTALALLAHTAAAEFKAIPAKPSVQPPPAAPAATSTKPLQKPVTLTPALKMQVKRNPLTLPIHLEQLDQMYREMAEKASEYEVGTATMPAILKECAEKSYSVQDQMAAGCSGNETLNQCMDKLVHRCIETFSTAGISWGGIGGIPAGSTPTFSTQAFRESAKQTAAKARALSQKLQQYAIQAERNAASWK